MSIRIFKIVMIAILTALSLPTAALAGLGTMDYTVLRSDGSSPTQQEKHEFNGGKHSFFSTMNEPSQVGSWIEQMSDRDAYKQGWSRLVFGWASPIRSIVLHRANVNSGTIKDGWLKLEVRTVKGNWVTLFEREGADLRKPVTISGKLHGIGPCTGVRFIFRSPEPMTIGPIDVNL